MMMSIYGHRKLVITQLKVCETNTKFRENRIGGTWPNMIKCGEMIKKRYTLIRLVGYVVKRKRKGPRMEDPASGKIAMQD